MADFIAGLILFSLLILSIIGIGLSADSIKQEKSLEKCARENNVYECEFIAIPKKDKSK